MKMENAGRMPAFPETATTAYFQSSVRNGVAGRPAPFSRLHTGFAAHA